MVLSQKIRKYVKGHEIVKIELNPKRDKHYGIIYEPVIILDNGVRIYFIAQETKDGAYYGVEPIINIIGLENKHE